MVNTLEDLSNEHVLSFFAFNLLNEPFHNLTTECKSQLIHFNTKRFIHGHRHIAMHMGLELHICH